MVAVNLRLSMLSTALEAGIVSTDSNFALLNGVAKATEARTMKESLDQIIFETVQSINSETR